MKQRIITGVVGACIVLPIIYTGSILFAILTYVLATIGIGELLQMRKISIVSVPTMVTLVVTWSIMNSGYYVSLEKVAVYAMLILLSYTVISKNKFTFDDVGFVLLTSFYVGMGCFSFMYIREMGLSYIAYVLLVIWVTDSGAYFIGRSMGRNKLWPEISPNKTIEGAVGGTVIATVAAVIFHLFLPLDFTWTELIAITVVLSVFGQLGDLAESAFKRHYFVKDSGKILPGHGGILDRIDSLLFVLPLFYFLS